MQKELQEQLKQFLGYIIWDCFHNDIKVDDSACNGVTNYIFNGVGGDNKLFEIWLERFNELIDQNFIGKEEVREKIEKIKFEEIDNGDSGIKYPTAKKSNPDALMQYAYNEAIKNILELLK